WNYSKNIGVTPKDVTKGSAKKFWWVCEKGHEWQSTIAHRTTMHRGCPYCSGRLPIKGETDLLTLYPSLASEWNYEKNGNLLPSEVTTGTPSKVWWLCKEGHEWIAGIAHRTKEGTNCPYCSGSKTERLVYAYLKELQIPFTAEKKFEQDIKVKWFPFDVWISSKRLIIEPDGKQHFTDKIPYFEDNVPFQERRRRDNAKNEFCLKYKIPILRIPYTYKSDTEKEKIKSMIKDFIETRKIPQEIIDFYEQYKENNNYAEIARKLNELN
ncbi:MAG: zinc-ribbon domain-containing protein, partial [Lachnospiraceae bacterium]|nr:zinc-ribbon domain-containing protein [Lachnospiraceae bacterium]